MIVDLKRNEIASRAKLPRRWGYGLTFDPEGKRLFSGGEFEVVHQYSFADGKLTDHAELQISDVKAREIPTGLACSRDGKTLFVANGWGSRISMASCRSINRRKSKTCNWRKIATPMPCCRRATASGCW